LEGRHNFGTSIVTFKLWPAINFLEEAISKKKIIRRLRPEHLTDNVLRKDKLGSKAIGENT